MNDRQTFTTHCPICGIQTTIQVPRKKAISRKIWVCKKCVSILSVAYNPKRHEFGSIKIRMLSLRGKKLQAIAVKEEIAE